MTTTTELLDTADSFEESVIRRRQFNYVTTIADIIGFAGLEGAEVFPSQDGLRSIAKLAEGGIVFNKTLYKLPHTAAIACQTMYSEDRWKKVDGWKFWSVESNGEVLTLAEVREQYLDQRMRNGDVISD